MKSLNPLQEIGAVKPLSRNSASGMRCLNPLQEIGAVKPEKSGPAIRPTGS